MLSYGMVCLLQMMVLANLQPFAGTGENPLPWAEASANFVDIAGVFILMRVAKV